MRKPPVRPRSSDHLIHHVIQVVLVTVGFAASAHGEWKLRQIDNRSRGADGIRVADINGDNLPDLVTGWEEGGQIRLCLNPGPAHCRDLWPSICVGRVKTPEDAAFADVNGDGWLDIVSSCEGRTRTVYLHRNPGRDRLLDPQAWSTEPVPASSQQAQWMFALADAMPPRKLPLRGIFCGSKGPGASIGRWSLPGLRSNTAAWRWREFRGAGWIMSLALHDMDGDGDQDLVFSDRKGPRRGCGWLERPDDEMQRWPEHSICGQNSEVMFLSLGDLDNDGDTDLAVATRDGPILIARRQDTGGTKWIEETVAMPPRAGTGKGVAIADLNQDGLVDLAVTCENASGKHGVFLMRGPLSGTAMESATRQFEEISGDSRGVKFDLIQLLDLDQDGDLDLLTCEERDNLGVIWYENPTLRPESR